jgi:L-arabinose isomerase
LEVAATAWIYAGGAHHTAFSQAIDSGFVEGFAEMLGIECVMIDEKTDLRALRNELRWNSRTY